MRVLVCVRKWRARVPVRACVRQKHICALPAAGLPSLTLDGERCRRRRRHQADLQAAHESRWALKKRAVAHKA